MSDRSSGTIEFGGTVVETREYGILDFCVEVANECPTIDWETQISDPDDVFQYLVKCAKEREPAFFCAHEIPGGSFEVIEAALRKLGLSYLSFWDGCCGAYHGGCAAWRPGMEHPVEAFGDTDTYQAGIPTSWLREDGRTWGDILDRCALFDKPPAFALRETTNPFETK